MQIRKSLTLVNLENLGWYEVYAGLYKITATNDPWFTEIVEP